MKFKEFREFIGQGIVKKQGPDISRANFLTLEAEKDHSALTELLNRIGINDNNTNSIIKSCYDIIMELVRAKMLLDGYNAVGAEAHKAEVSYLKILGFNENEVQFADKMRFFRNGMLYYGTMLDKEYAEKVVSFMNKILPSLKKLIKEKL